MDKCIDQIIVLYLCLHEASVDKWSFYLYMSINKHFHQLSLCLWVNFTLWKLIEFMDHFLHYLPLFHVSDEARASLGMIEFSQVFPWYPHPPNPQSVWLDQVSPNDQWNSYRTLDETVLFAPIINSWLTPFLWLLILPGWQLLLFPRWMLSGLLSAYFYLPRFIVCRLWN